MLAIRMAQHYDRFCELEQAEIQRYKNKEKRDDRSVREICK